MNTKETPLILDLLNGKMVSRPPVWFMRQAGRCLPSYRKLREQYSFEDVLTTPKLAAKVTLLPIQELGVDVAILFSDITIIAKRLGLSLKFPEGKPRIFPTLSNYLDNPTKFLKKLKTTPDNFTKSAAEFSLTLLPPHIPLIGFCGGPLSTLFYLFRDHNLSQSDQIITFVRWLLLNKELSQLFFAKITEACNFLIEDLSQCGIKIFQIFETHADMVPWDFYVQFVLPWSRMLFSSIRKNNMFCIFFPKGVGLGNMDLIKEPIDVLSVDWQTSFANLTQFQNKICLQGNIDPRMIQESCISEIVSICERNWKLTKGKLIINLGHGVLPDTSSNTLKKLCNILQKNNWNLST